jgi:predicted DNA-binding protein with PD1-like motif
MIDQIRTKWAKGKVGRIVSARILPGTDFISGIEKICIENKIEGGTFSAIGSLEKATFFLPTKKEGTKKGAGYSEPKTITGPIELLSSEGFISKDPESDSGLFIHIHGIINDTEGRLYGGHFLKGENPILLTLDVVIFEFADVSLSRDYDPEIGMKLIIPAPKQ